MTTIDALFALHKACFTLYQTGGRFGDQSDSYAELILFTDGYGRVYFEGDTRIQWDTPEDGVQKLKLLLHSIRRFQPRSTRALLDLIEDMEGAMRYA